MIGIDTNILLRVFIDDDPAQVRAVRKRVAEAEAGQLFISIVVMVEFVWTLQAAFKVQRRDLIGALEGVLTRAVFVVEDRAEVEAALNRLKLGNVDFADVLISTRNMRHGVDRTVSFDQSGIRQGLFEPLE